MPILNLEDIVQKISNRLEEVEKARDASYTLHRELIKKAGITIRAAHRLEKDTAYTLLHEGQEILRQLNSTISGFEELPRSGFIHDAHKEFAESAITTAIIFGDPIPDPNKLEVVYNAYLRGMAETIGELRRRILDMMRQDRGDEGEYLLDAMEEIYAILVTMDFSDAVTGGLRHSTDQARGILERTRGDFTNYIVSKRLRVEVQKYTESTCSCS